MTVFRNWSSYVDIKNKDNSAYHCQYIFRWTYLIDKYNLSASKVDKDKISDVMRACELN